MKKRKGIRIVCMVCGVIVVCILVLVMAAGYLLSKGYGMTFGRLHFREDRVYLMEEGDSAIILSDRSRGQNVFEGFHNGDEVLVIHDGVEETYPARTGAYFILRMAEGDRNYQPDNEALGIFQMDLGDENPLDQMEEYPFEVQYIRTNVRCEGIQYPDARIIRSAEELQMYYEQYKEAFDLERREDPSSDSTIGFLDACDKYDAVYFEEQTLLMVILEEGSGSIRHKVNSVGIQDSNLLVNIERLVPEAGTDDMAEWHVLIELPAEAKNFSKENLLVYIDGEDRTVRTDWVAYEKGYGDVVFELLKTWEYEVEDNESEVEFCINIWPKGHSEGELSIKYFGDHFGVCGTGLEQKEIQFFDYKANQGTYDNNKYWSYIKILDVPGDYVIMNGAKESWWEHHAAEAMQILSTLKVAERVISEEEAIEIAKAKARNYVEYHKIEAEFDIDNDIWEVCFFQENTAGGDQTIEISAWGNILSMSWGE